MKQTLVKFKCPNSYSVRSKLYKPLNLYLKKELFTRTYASYIDRLLSLKNWVGKKTYE